MKKFILFFIFTMCISLHAQNPDGKNASLHIMPSWLWGNADFTRNTTVWYPASFSSPEQNVTTQNTGMIHNPFSFGINAMIKIPATSFLTMSVSYSFNQKFEEDKEYLHYWSLNGRLHKVSFTVSAYNLFSLYQE